MSSNNFEYIVVGGGLQNGLIALALLARGPNSRIAILEREAQLGGNHTWCFHQADLPAASDRPQFLPFMRMLGGLIRPLMLKRADRLWIEDAAYAERRYALRTRRHGSL